MPFQTCEAGGASATGKEQASQLISESVSVLFAVANDGFSDLPATEETVGENRGEEWSCDAKRVLIKIGSARQMAEERPRRAATSRNILLKAKGLMLTRTIVNMVIIAMAVPVRPAECPYLPSGGSLASQSRTDKIQVFFRQAVVGLNPQRLLVMGYRGIVLPGAHEYIPQFFVSDLE